MNEQHRFADVDLPFHAWVREPGARGFRWVLRSVVNEEGSSNDDQAVISDRAPDGSAGGADLA